MAEKRMIHRRITESDKLLELAQRGHYRACMIYAFHLPYLDKAGRMRANPHGLKGTTWEAWPMTAADIAHDLDQMADVGLVVLYRSQRHELLAEYTKFTDAAGGFNKPHNNEPESELPAPGSEGCSVRTALDVVTAGAHNVPHNVVGNVLPNVAPEYEYEYERERERESNPEPKDDSNSSEARTYEALASGRYDSQDASRARSFFKRLIGTDNAKHPQCVDNLTRWYQDRAETEIRALWQRAKDNPDGKERLFWFIDVLNGRRRAPKETADDPHSVGSTATHPEHGTVTIAGRKGGEYLVTLHTGEVERVAAEALS